MSKLFPQIAEVILNNPANPLSFCESFVYEPTNVEEENLGYLYIVGQVVTYQQDRSQAAYLLNLIATETSRDFYKKTKSDPKAALEKTLGHVNQAIQNLQKENKLGWLDHINLIVLLFNPKTQLLSFSATGKSQLLLWRKGRIINIGKDFASQSSQSSQEKLFDSVASGKIESQDRLLASVPALTDKYSLQKIKAVIDQSQYQPLSSFKNILGIKEENDLAIIFLTTSTTPSQTVSSSKKTKASIEEGPEKDIQNKPQKKAATINVKKLSSSLKKIAKIGVWLLGLVSLFKIIAKKLAPLFRKLKRGISKVLKNIFIKIKHLINKGERKQIPQFSFKSFLPKKSTKKILPLFKKIPKKYLIVPLFLIALASLLTFILSITQKTQEKEISDLPTKEQAIEEPLQLVDLSKRTLSFTGKGLFSLEGGLFFFDSTSVFNFNLANKEGSFLFPPLEQGEKMLYQATLENNYVYLSSNKRIITLKTEEQNFTIGQLGDISEENILDLATYGDNIYLLSESGHIFKYPNLNFAQRTIWLEKHQDFGEQFVSFAIDGAIYVLEKGGLVYKYMQGKQVEDFLIAIEGDIKRGDKIFTLPDFKNLYILAASQNKIYVFDKENQTLIKSFSSPKWQNMTNFYVDNLEQNIYLLDNLKTYKIKL